MHLLTRPPSRWRMRLHQNVHPHRPVHTRHLGGFRGFRRDLLRYRRGAALACLWLHIRSVTPPRRRNRWSAWGCDPCAPAPLSGETARLGLRYGRSEFSKAHKAGTPELSTKSLKISRNHRALVLREATLARGYPRLRTLNGVIEAEAPTLGAPTVSAGAICAGVKRVTNRQNTEP